MHRFLLVSLLLACALIVPAGCGGSPAASGTGAITAVGGENYVGRMFARPEFIDERPPDMVSKCVVDEPLESSGDDLDGVDKAGPDPNAAPPHKYALVIGISDYAGTANDLSYCDDDATDWNAYLRSQGFTVELLLDAGATRAAILRKLTWLKSVAVTKDEIAFIYSGHGTRYGSQGSCIISADLYYLTHTTVMNYVNGSRSRKRMVAVDACKVGDFNNDCKTGTITATASLNTYSYDGDASMANGVWTYFYLDRLVNQREKFNENAAKYAQTRLNEWGRALRLATSPSSRDLYPTSANTSPDFDI